MLNKADRESGEISNSCCSSIVGLSQRRKIVVSTHHTIKSQKRCFFETVTDRKRWQHEIHDARKKVTRLDTQAVF